MKFENHLNSNYRRDISISGLLLFLTFIEFDWFDLP